MRGEDRQGALGEGAQLLRAAGLALEGSFGWPWRARMFLRGPGIWLALEGPHVFAWPWKAHIFATMAKPTVDF